MSLAPARVQRKNTLGWTTPLDDQGRKAMYVGRGSRWGNQFVVVKGASIIFRGSPWSVRKTKPRLMAPIEVPCESEEAARALAVKFFAAQFQHSPDLVEAVRQDLAGRDLMCWCPLPEPGEPDHCHAAVLLPLANPDATRWPPSILTAGVILHADGSSPSADPASMPAPAIHESR